MTFVTTARLQREFGLPRALAAEIVADGMRHALHRRWQPWAWLLVSLGLPATGLGLGWMSWQALRHGGGVLVLIVALGGWCLSGQWLAGEGMLAAATAKARRLGDGSAR